MSLVPHFLALLPWPLALLLKESDYLEQEHADALINENKSLIRMLTASIKTAKNKLKSNNQR